MDDLLLKFNSLDIASKKAVKQLIDLLAKKTSVNKKNEIPYKEKILSVSVWSEEDIKEIGAGEPFNQFKPQEW